MVLRVCRAVVGPDDADDAWSETFVSALRAYPDLDADANIEAWLVTIAHRRALDVVRTRARQAIPLDSIPDRPASAPAETDPDLWAAVAQLPTRQRQALAYHYLGGLKYPQIAELIGSSPDATRRAAADGMRTLRPRITKETSHV
mgnify:CR=1 FL=1